jgi:hypothetical protein
MVDMEQDDENRPDPCKRHMDWSDAGAVATFAREVNLER